MKSSEGRSAGNLPNRVVVLAAVLVVLIVLTVRSYVDDAKTCFWAAQDRPLHDDHL